MAHLATLNLVQAFWLVAFPFGILCGLAGYLLGDFYGEGVMDRQRRSDVSNDEFDDNRQR